GRGLASLAPNAAPHADERPNDETHQGGRPRTGGRLWTVHRDGILPADPRRLRPHVQPQFRGTERDGGRPRVSVQPGDRGGDGARREDHGSPGPGEVAGLPGTDEVDGRYVLDRVAAKRSQLALVRPRPDHRPLA